MNFTSTTIHLAACRNNSHQCDGDDGDCDKSDAEEDVRAEDSGGEHLPVARDQAQEGG